MSTDNNSAFTIDAVKTLMERIAPLVIDHEAVEYLVARIRRVIVDDSASTMSAKSRQLMHSSLHLLRVIICCLTLDNSTDAIHQIVAW